MELSIFYILALAVALGLDAFSVALSLGVYSCLPVQVAKVAVHFGMFQFMMPIIGFYLGSNIIQYIRQYDHWVAFGCLFLVGMKMLIESLKKEEGEGENGEMSEELIKLKCERFEGWTLIGLAVATSIDALAVGLSFGIAETGIWFPSIIIGIVAAAMSVAGMLIGNRLSAIFGKRMETVGAIVLLLLSIKMLSI